jgi:peptide/nickel transport system permease protein
VSLTIGFASVVVSTLLGTAVGAAAGWAGGRWDGLLMRLTDVVLVFPPLFLMIAVVGVFGSSVPLLVIVIGITSWPLSARIVRGEILTLRTREFIDAARVLGVSGPAIVVRHLLPNAAWAILVSATLRVPAALLTEAGLSYVGLGVLPPDPSWGNMVADGKAALETAWWVSAFPGIFIALAVLGCTLAGDGLRDA